MAVRASFFWNKPSPVLLLYVLCARESFQTKHFSPRLCRKVELHVWDLMAMVLLMAEVVGQRNMILLLRKSLVVGTKSVHICGQRQYRNHSLTPPRGEWGSLRGVIESGLGILHISGVGESNHECSSKKEVV